MVIDPSYLAATTVVAPGLTLDNFLPIPNAESLPFYPLVLKLVVWVGDFSITGVCYSREKLKLACVSAQCEPLLRLAYLPGSTTGITKYSYGNSAILCSVSSFRVLGQPLQVRLFTGIFSCNCTSSKAEQCRRAIFCPFVHTDSQGAFCSDLIT